MRLRRRAGTVFRSKARTSRRRVHLAPVEGGRDRRPGVRADAVGGGQQLAAAVLQGVHVDPAAAGGDRAGGGGDRRQSGDDHPGEQLGELPRRLVRELPAHRQQDVQAAAAARLHEAGHPDLVAQLADGERDLHHVGERRRLRIEVQDAPVRMLRGLQPAGSDVERDRAEIHQRQQPLHVVHRLAPLEERLAGDAVRIAVEHQRAVAQEGEQPGGDGAVILDQIPLGDPLARPENLVEIGELDGFFSAGSASTASRLILQLRSSRSSPGRKHSAAVLSSRRRRKTGWRRCPPSVHSL